MCALRLTARSKRAPRACMTADESSELAQPMARSPCGDPTAACEAASQSRRQRATPRSKAAWPAALRNLCSCCAGLLVLAACSCGAGICPQCGADGCQCPPAAERMAPPGASRWLTDYSLPDGIIVGEYTGVMQRAYAAFGVRLLSVDYGPSDDAGVWHYQGDAREIVYSRRWPILIAHPTCKHVARSGQKVWPKKIADGSHWWVLANILVWLCAPALAVLIEQPIGAFEKYL